MFESLDSIPWESLAHAFGPAINVPGLLRDLGSESPETRGQARSWLANILLYEGEVFPAAPVAVPFLLESVAEPTIPERAEILRILADLATGGTHRWLDWGYDVLQADIAAWLATPEAVLERATYEAVEQGLPTFRALLGDSDPQVRSAAAFALSWFARDAASLRDLFSEKLETEEEPEVRASLMLALALQDRYRDASVALDHVAAALAKPFPEDLAAAIGLHWYGENPHLNAAFPVLRKALEAPPSDIVFPWNQGDLAGLGLRMFRRHAATRLPEVSSVLLGLVQQVEKISQPLNPAERRGLEAVPALVASLFPEGEPVPEALGEDQRRFLKLLVDRPFLALPGLFDALEARGLPGDFDGLRALLGEAAAPSVLAAPLTLGEVTQSLGEWLDTEVEQEEEALRIRKAVVDHLARGERPVATAFDLAIEMGADLALDVVEAAAALAAEPVYDEAMVLASLHIASGPPMRYGREGREYHPAALLVILVAATASARVLERVPDWAFEPLPKAFLDDPQCWPRVEAFLDLLPEERRFGLFRGLAQSGWTTWPDLPAIEVDEPLLAGILAWLEPEHAAELLAIEAPRHPDTVLPFLPALGTVALVSALIRPLAMGLETLAAWNPADLEQAIQEQAEWLASLGFAAWPVLDAASRDPDLPRREVFENALALIDAGSYLATAMTSAELGLRDERGLMPLEAARALAQGAQVFEDVEPEEESGIRPADLLWAALLSLADGAEFVAEATRLRWEGHVRDEADLAILERYGEEALPFIRSRVSEGVLSNVPHCVASCILALDTPAALELALQVQRIDDRLPKDRTDALPEGDALDLPRRWIDRNTASYGDLAKLAEGGNDRARTLILDRAEALGAVVREAMAEALGPDEASRLAQALALPAPSLPTEVQLILASSPEADIPRGPLWSIAELDEAAAQGAFPTFDNPAYTVGAMRVSGFASEAGDALIVETLLHAPGSGEPVTRELLAFGPGAGQHQLTEVLVSEAELRSVRIDDTTQVDGVTGHIHVWGDHDEKGRPVEDSGGERVIPQPFPLDLLLLDRDEGVIALDYHLPASLAGIEDPEILRLVTPMEGLLLSLGADDTGRFLDDETLVSALELPPDAQRLFAFDALRIPLLGETARSSPDLLLLTEALRARRVPERLAGVPNTDPGPWLAACARQRAYAGGNAWAPGDAPVATPRPSEGPGVHPYQNLLFSLGWPHGVRLLHDPESNLPGSGRAIVEDLLQGGAPRMHVLWPRDAALAWVRVLGMASRALDIRDRGVQSALARDVFLYETEAANLVGGFTTRAWDLPAAVAADFVLLLEALIGGEMTLLLFAQALGATPVATGRNRPGLAAAVRELGFVLRRIPIESPWLEEETRRVRDRNRAEVTEALELIGKGLKGNLNDVGRALDLALHGREGAERSARNEADYAHCVDDPGYARSRLLDPATPHSPPDAWLVALAGDEMLERYAPRMERLLDPEWFAIQLGTLRTPRAPELLLRLIMERPEAAEAAGQALSDRPEAWEELAAIGERDDEVGELAREILDRWNEPEEGEELEEEE